MKQHKVGDRKMSIGWHGMIEITKRDDVGKKFDEDTKEVAMQQEENGNEQEYGYM